MPDTIHKQISSKTTAEAWVSLTSNQEFDLKNVIDLWDQQQGLVIASLVKTKEGTKITFRTVPMEIGKRIIAIVDEFYEGENDANS